MKTKVASYHQEDGMMPKKCLGCYRVATKKNKKEFVGLSEESYENKRCQLSSWEWFDALKMFGLLQGDHRKW